MNIFRTVYLLTAGLILMPFFAYAQQDFQSIVGGLTDFLLTLVPLLSSAALLFFFWGLADYVFQAGDKDAVETGKQRMIWGLVGLFAIAAVWGIVRFVGSALTII